MLHGVQGLVSSICKKPADPYQPAASCSPNYCWCDNYSPSLISHLIAKVYFLLSRAQFNSTTISQSDICTPAPIVSVRFSRGNRRDHTESAVCPDKLVKRWVYKPAVVIYMSGLMSYMLAPEQPSQSPEELVGRDRRGSWSDNRWLLWAQWSLLFGA